MEQYQENEQPADQPRFKNMTELNKAFEAREIDEEEYDEYTHQLRDRYEETPAEQQTYEELIDSFGFSTSAEETKEIEGLKEDQRMREALDAYTKEQYDEMYEKDKRLTQEIYETLLEYAQEITEEKEYFLGLYGDIMTTFLFDKAQGIVDSPSQEKELRQAVEVYEKYIDEMENLRLGLKHRIDSDTFDIEERLQISLIVVKMQERLSNLYRVAEAVDTYRKINM